MITFDGIEVRYGDHVAIPQLDLTIEEGEFFTLLGPSGCGKTTALRTLAGLTTPSRGRISVDGRDVTDLAPHRRGVAMVFQNYALFPTMDVADNIGFGLGVKRVPAAEKARRVTEAAQLVELSEAHMHRRLDELSGGQQQRVAIARALVLRPSILLMDEPLSNLDAKLRHQMRGQLKELQAEVGITAVYVTHDQDEALAMSDRIAVFHEGRIEQVGTPEEVYSTSATEFVCRFVGDSTKLGPQLASRLLGEDAGGVAYLRTERARLEDAPGRVSLEGRMARRTYQGTHSIYEVQVLDTLLRLVVPELGRRHPEEGDEVRVHIDPAAVLRYEQTEVRR